jgi:urease accessory protein
MPDLPPAVRLHAPGHGLPVHDLVTLAWADRRVQRAQLVTVHGETFGVALHAPVRLDHGDAFELQDGRVIEVIAAEEPLAELRGPQLALYAWHAGNRHALCQIEPGRLLLRRDPALVQFLRDLGATVRDVSEPFHPAAAGHAAADHTDTGHPATRHPLAARGDAAPPALVDHDLPGDGPFGPG